MFEVDKLYYLDQNGLHRINYDNTGKETLLANHGESLYVLYDFDIYLATGQIFLVGADVSFTHFGVLRLENDGSSPTWINDGAYLPTQITIAQNDGVIYVNDTGNLIQMDIDGSSDSILIALTSRDIAVNKWNTAIYATLSTSFVQYTMPLTGPFPGPQYILSGPSVLTNPQGVIIDDDNYGDGTSRRFFTESYASGGVGYHPSFHRKTIAIADLHRLAIDKTNRILFYATPTDIYAKYDPIETTPPASWNVLTGNPVNIYALVAAPGRGYGSSSSSAAPILPVLPPESTVYTVVKNLKNERIFLSWFPTGSVLTLGTFGRWLEPRTGVRFAGNLFEAVLGYPGLRAVINADIRAGRVALNICQDSPMRYDPVDASVNPPACFRWSFDSSSSTWAKR